MGLVWREMCAPVRNLAWRPAGPDGAGGRMGWATRDMGLAKNNALELHLTPQA